MFESSIPGLERLHQGKVRDVYALDADHLLIVTTDRLSAFDVVLPDPIPDKGRVLTEISRFWFARTRHIIANHLTARALDAYVADASLRAALAERSMVVRRLSALPIEAVVRGYLIGSGWRDYQESGAVCGVVLPPGLSQADRLPAPIFTPATKAAQGEHDANISFDAAERLVGRERAGAIRTAALALYAYASAHALERGIIIADTKFEFGVDADGHLILIDEALTPDSSRFWPVDSYRPGTSPPSFDKQFVRDYLETLGWDKRPPAPHLPDDVIAGTSARYAEALRRLTS
jgi:phosphoribosylaminoimidazole-succinocarboxamide synthase